MQNDQNPWRRGKGSRKGKKYRKGGNGVESGTGRQEKVSSMSSLYKNEFTKQLWDSKKEETSSYWALSSLHREAS